MKFFLILFSSLSLFTIAQQKSSATIIDLENQVRQNLYNSSNYNTVNLNSYEESKKSIGLGIIYSLLLPGMGELYAGSYDIGKYFTIAEGVLWGTYIGMNTYANWKQDDYKSYASQHANVNNTGKNEEYYGIIGDYSDIDSYNDEKALDRRFDEMYNRDQFYWKWQTMEERRTYRSMWTASEQTFNDLRFVVGAMILNRVATAVNAARLVASYNNNLQQDLGWNVSVDLKNSPLLPTSLSINFIKNF